LQQAGWFVSLLLVSFWHHGAAIVVGTGAIVSVVVSIGSNAVAILVGIVGGNTVSLIVVFVLCLYFCLQYFCFLSPRCCLCKSSSYFSHRLIVVGQPLLVLTAAVLPFGDAATIFAYWRWH